MNRSIILFSALSAVFAASAWSQNYIDILPGSHSTPITRVSYEVDGATVEQTSEATGVQVRRNDPVYLKSITVQDGSITRKLDAFNSLGAKAVNIGFSTNTGGVGVFNNGTITNTSNLDAFASALSGITQDTDLLNYCYNDGVSNMPGSGVADYDLIFQHGFESSDFLLVSERWGNTYFTLAPLDSSGKLISGANTLRFGYPTGGAYTKYDWNSGYASSSYVTDQAMAFSAASVSKFFQSSSATPQTIYGFRVDNNGEADVKFFGLSDSSFVNNPINPAIPEPSAALLVIFSLVPLALRRRC